LESPLEKSIQDVQSVFATETKNLTSGAEGTFGAYLNGELTPTIKTAVDGLKQALDEGDFSIKQQDIEKFQKLKTSLDTVTNNGGATELAKQFEDLLFPKQ
jgi:hypothetical protein